MDIYRPLQLSFIHQVLEQNRKFYFTASATLGINLKTGETILDLNYLKDIFECMGENPLPDMGMPKPNGEFLVSGSFYSPDCEPVAGGEVKIRLGNTEKNLYIFGPRKWLVSGLPSKPEPITTMAINYRKAFGGKDYDKNPDGMGLSDNLLPRIENPTHLIASKNDKPDPAGFGPLYPMLPQRMQFQGTYDAGYREKYFPGYPADHDWKFFLTSPSDQWTTGFYTGDESYSIYNMHPDIPVISGKLPGFHARCFINQYKSESQSIGELPLNLDTIWFFPEKLIALLIFRGVTEVEDDEAKGISHVLCAYEDQSQPPRSIEYYQSAFEKRQNSDDELLKNLNTRDLIPEGHLSAMEILIGNALDGDSHSALTRNMEAKSDEIQKMVDEQVEKLIQDTENGLKTVNIPDDAWEHIPDDAKTHMPGKSGGLDIRKLMTQQKDTAPDPDIEKLNKQLESMLPGITSKDSKKIDMKDFSFDKTSTLFDAVDELVQKKKKDIEHQVKKETDKAGNDIKEKIQDIDKQIENAKKSTDPNASHHIKALEDSKLKMIETLEVLDHLDLNTPRTQKAPLPRIDSRKIMEQAKQMPPSQLDPRVMEALQHVQAMKMMGEDKEKTDELEKEIQKQLDASREQVESALDQANESIKEVEQNFKDTYIMGAHFMNEGLSPHKQDLETIKKQFLDAVSNQEDVSGRDWACIDLEGINLDGIDLSGAFLEQVNFKGASLKGANLSRAILSRAILDGAVLTGANLEEANIGAVKAHKAIFTKARLKSAKLSRGDFTQADFTNADLEDVESLEIIIDHTVFAHAHMPRVNFIETKFSGAVFQNADMDTSAFIKCHIETSDFSQSIMTRCAFVDTSLLDCKFQKADLSNACFVSTDPEKIITTGLDFSDACLTQTNFQGMRLQRAIFKNADMENAFFGNADLSGANLSGARAKNAQFRKADLTNATLDKINLDQGSLAKANLANASFKGANLFSVDFLRSNISHTDFSLANLDNTLIEHWRPE